MSFKTLYRVGLVLAILAGPFVVPAMAEGGEPAAAAAAAPADLYAPFKSLGTGLIVLGAAIGIGILASSAMEGTARQPEAAGDIRTTMIIAAALIEGFTLLALVL